MVSLGALMEKLCRSLWWSGDRPSGEDKGLGGSSRSKERYKERIFAGCDIVPWLFNSLTDCI